MPFYRFEQFEPKLLTPHLSSGAAPVIEGRYMYFCLLHKDAGTGSELHYHPNELLIFPVRGRINAIVGKDRRIVAPGTFVHCPAYARHSMKATEDAPVDYLYIKDLTWTVVGVAADEAVPERAMTVDEVNRKHASGAWPGEKKEPQRSQAIVDGLADCYYPIIAALDAPPASARRSTWIEGERLAFGFVELPQGASERQSAAQHEFFVYLLQGEAQIEVDGERKRCGVGDIAHVPRGGAWSLDAHAPTRYAAVRSTEWLERRIDTMSPEEQARARVERKAN
jgi:quercetin dioxygenase-like cupin family protein